MQRGMTHAAHHTHELFARTTQSATPSQQEHDRAAEMLRYMLAEGNKIEAERQQLKAAVKRRTKLSTCGALTGYLLVVAFVLWLVFSTRSRVAARSASLSVERTCVNMHRLKVATMTPAIDSRVGGALEPFVFGTLTFSLASEEVVWQLDESLGIEPFRLVIRGPLAVGGGSGSSASAPVFVELGLQRNDMMQLAGAASTTREKLMQIRSEPSRFYLSIDEKLSGGRVRELVRDYLNHSCVPGVK